MFLLKTNKPKNNQQGVQDNMNLFVYVKQLKPTVGRETVTWNGTEYKNKRRP